MSTGFLQRNELGLGAGLQLTDHVSDGELIELEFSDQTRANARVHQSYDAKLVLEVGDLIWEFIPWEENHDPLPRIEKEVSRWTCNTIPAN
jgi:hypothetical protein